MTKREAVFRLREWYKAFDNFGKGNERTVKEFLEIEDLIHSMDAELTLVKKERDDLQKGMEAATSLLDEYSQNFPRWISVEERLPEGNDDVLVFVQHPISGHCWTQIAHRLSAMALDECDEYDEWWLDGSGETVRYITHWMPLPEPPKEE